MSENAIVVDGLSKRYLIGHRFSSGGHYSYTSMREVVGREIRNFARKATDVVHGRQVVQGDAIEEFWALKDVSFELKQGEILGIVGRNGAGKSTLLKILSRITEPTSGRVVLRGRVSSLLEVGTGFHPELTGRENIFLNGAILGMAQREIRQKFDEIVAFAEIETFLDTPVKHYSSGMYVRLAFAVAAHLEPEILIVDEVLAVGDIEFQKKCIGKMNDVSRKDGRTVLFVSHNHAAIRGLCTHGLVLRGGHASPKCDVTSALKSYLSDRPHSSTSSWTRPANLGEPPVHFSYIEVGVDGKQPKLMLNCRAKISSAPGGRAFSMAMLIADRNSMNIMQIQPTNEKSIGGLPGIYSVELSAELPPLIPGLYTLSFWIGIHRGEIFDWAEDVLTVEIVDSPDPSRILPYLAEQGSVVPISAISVSRSELGPTF